MKLHHLLEQEADELKRLLGGRAGAMAGKGGVPGGAVDEDATRVALSRLKTDMASRRLHEAGVSASEVRIFMCEHAYVLSNLFVYACAALSTPRVRHVLALVETLLPPGFARVSS